MSLATLIRGMAAAGASPEAIALAVEAIEAEQNKAAEKRAQAAARKRAQRERDSHVTVTGQSQDGEGVVTATTPAPAPSLPPDPQPTPTHTPAKRPRAREAERLPDDWKPAKLDRSTVSGQIVENRGQEWARRALESFKNHWRSANGPNARKRDWQAAFANWVIEQDNRDGTRTNPVGRHKPADGLSPTTRAAERVFGVPFGGGKQRAVSG